MMFPVVSGTQPYDIIEIKTWAEFMAASPEEQRAFMREVLAEWEMNRARELAEDERGDSVRGHWGD